MNKSFEMDKNRISRNLKILQSTNPDVHNRCSSLLDKIEETPTAIFDAINSPDMNEKQAGIYLIACLADASYDEETTRITHFARSLLKILTMSPEPVIKLASKAIAYLILTSKSYAVELMEVTLNQCFEWLEEPQRNEQRRLAAVILTKNLSLFTESHFFQRANQFFNNIFKVLHDPKTNLRLAASEALQAAFTVISQRETKHKNEWYNKCVKEACQNDFPGMSRDDVIHGSLLIFNELMRIANFKHEMIRLQLTNTQPSKTRSIIGQNPVEWLLEPIEPMAVESRTSRTIVTDYFQEIVKKCLEARNCKTATCQAILLEIFPRLASFIDTSGSTPFYHVIETAEHALVIVNKYPDAMLTLGLLALSRPSEIRPKVPQILGILIQHIQFAISKKKQLHSNDFKCVSLIVRSQRSFICEKIRELLPLFFSTGISEGLIELMHDIISAIPELRADVIDGLMDQLYQLLMAQPRPSKLAPPTAPPLPTGPIQPANVPQTKLALKTLGEFNFSRHSLQMFLRYVAMGYLTSESVEIRLTSVFCCTEMLKPFIHIYDHVENPQKLDVYTLIRNVLECLVKTSIVDTDFNVRLNVLRCFCNMNTDFLFHLAQRELLGTVFMTLHDENYQVREQAVELLGRLSELNPAFVFLKFRRVLLESISQLVNSRTAIVEEHGARMVAHLAKQSPKFMSPYMHSVLISLIPHLKVNRSNVGVTVHVLNAVSELSLIGGLEIVRAVNKLFPPVITFIQDSTSLNRREAALRAMGRICQCAAYVVEPYKDYPDLLEILLHLLKTELSSSMRRLTMRVLGIIGALDPYTYKVYIGKVQSHIKSRSLALTLPNSGNIVDLYGLDIINWINYERLTLQEYYPALAVSNLLQMLDDSQGLTFFHKEIFHSLHQIFTNLGNRSQYVGQVIPQLITITENCKPEFREFFLSQFSKFISLFRLQMQPFMTKFFGLISKAWYWSEDPELRGTIIRLIEDVGSSFGEKFSIYVTDLCPYLLLVLQNDASPERKLILRALSCTRTIANCLGTHVHLILAPILLIIEDRESPEKIRVTALETVIELADRHPIMDRAPAIMQTWLRCVHFKFLQPKLMTLLSIIVRKWDQFPIYKESVNAAFKKHRVDQNLRKEYWDQLRNMQTTASLGVDNAQMNMRNQEQPTTSPTFARQIQFLPFPEGDGQATTSSAMAFNGEEEGYANGQKMARMPSGREIRYQVNLEQLRRHWSIHTLTSREDWLQWLSTLRTQFIRQSPSASIRACAVLAEAYEPLAKELFNAAFISIWTEIREMEQNQITNQFIDVIKSCPHAEPIQAILNLAEFMDHSEKGPLPIEYNVLSKSAEQTRAYAKALRYKELDILTSRKGEPTPDDCQSLIILFNKLNLEEGAAGIVQYAKRNNMEISGRWYEKLGEWEKALDMYKQEILSMPDTEHSWPTFSSNSSITEMSTGLEMSRQTSSILGTSHNNSTTHSRHLPHQNSGAKFDIALHQMRCLEALGQWSQLNNACQTALLDPEVDTHSTHIHHQSGPHQSSSQPSLVVNDFLNTTLNEVARRQKIAQMAAKANWGLGDFDKMAEYVHMVNESTQEGSFMRAVLAIRNENYEKAYEYINKVRDIFDSELTAMATESYERAYGAMTHLQELTELEEAIEFKMLPEREARIALLWSRRLQGCRPNIDHWRRILMVRSIVFAQNELRPLWIKFSALCRREGKQLIARNVLRSLLDIPSDVPMEKTNIPFDKPQLALAVCKQLWMEGHKSVAFSQLEQLTQTLHRLIEHNRAHFPREHLEPLSRITAKCYLKLGEWHESLQQPIVLPSVAERHGSISISSTAMLDQTMNPQQQQQYVWPAVGQQRSPAALYQPTGPGCYVQVADQSAAKKLHFYTVATNFDQNWYKAWHRLATTYYNLIMSEHQAQQLPSGIHQSTPVTPVDASYPQLMPATYAQPIPPVSPISSVIQQSPLRPHQLTTNYAVNAVKCFFKAIQLAESSRLDDTLRLLMLWFDYGDRLEVFEQLRDSLKLIPSEVWLEVVPQLIARLDSQQNNGLLVKQLVLDVTKAYPQAWIYALTAATKSRNVRRSQVAKEILEIVSENKKTLVEQAMLVNDELIRCAILWHEQWHEALEDASRFYFQDKNVEEMMNVLRPLHQRIEQGHITMKEMSFNHTYYKDLKEALDHCEVFRRTGSQKEMNAAWDIYYNVFKRISNQLRQMSVLDLNYISPLLSKARNLEVSVPGTYDPSSPLVTIASFHPHLQVIMSKQRPRKIYMRGSDGKEYVFLLKGHEDPRQDERVMQLFGLVNSLILREAETTRRNLTIQRYSITTLSQSSGLIGWVPNCDTLHALIKDYREKRKIPISEEHSKMQKLCVDIERCTLLQKVEVFEEALRSTTGDDLRQTLWMKSPNSEVWFDRRTNYTRSMATMSMVGYILGLGDRHPSNLMLDRLSGKIVHIDFGDCFEVAMRREKYPEKIPFRLTRMLIQAMEVTGIDGNYRLTCERLLRLLRNNNDSILAVLESFVYDPVLNWRLTEGATAKRAAPPLHNVGAAAIAAAGAEKPAADGVGGATTAGAVAGGERNWRPEDARKAAQRAAGARAAANRGDSEAIGRVKAKLCGRDFNPYVEISVPEQVDRLIEQATMNDNLCQCYIGWCPFW